MKWTITFTNAAGAVPLSRGGNGVCDWYTYCAEENVINFDTPEEAADFLRDKAAVSPHKMRCFDRYSAYLHSFYGDKFNEYVFEVVPWPPPKRILP